jgi:hypothetical protein
MENVFIAEMIVLLVLTILLLLVQLAYRYFMVHILMIMAVVLFVMINAWYVIHTILKCVILAKNHTILTKIQGNAFHAKNNADLVAAHRTAIPVC